MPRRVSARRTLAVVAALLALPWPLLALGDVDDVGEVWAAICAALIAAVVAGPLLAGSPRFGWVAGGLWFLLLALGFLFALAGGFVMWPAAFVFLVAALPRPEATWPTRRVLAVTGGSVAAVALVVGVVALVQDARDEPDLEVRLLPGETRTGFDTLLDDEPKIVGTSMTSNDPDIVEVELSDGLTPTMRSELAARLRGKPGVQSVQIDD